jgi:hypothetical protein
MTGEVAAGFTCQLPPTTNPPQIDAAVAAMREQLGSPGLDTAVPASEGWTMASWLVGHADTYDLSSVTFAGQTWSRDTSRWTSTSPATPGSSAAVAPTNGRVEVS